MRVLADVIPSVSAGRPEETGESSPQSAIREEARSAWLREARGLVPIQTRCSTSPLAQNVGPEWFGAGL